MKNLLSTIMVCFCALAMVDFSRASDPAIYIKWAYPNPPTDLAGYYLYINNSRAHDLNVPTAISWSGPVVLIDGNNTFEISPYDGAGQEGNKCAPYTLNYNAPPGGEIVITNVEVVNE